MALRECLMAHILAWGNGYCEIVRNGYGELSALWPITPNRVTPIMVDYELKYRIRLPDGADIILPREKVLHVPGLGFDGFLGYSVIAMARKSIGLGMAMETFGSRFFGEGTHPGVIVEHPGKLSPEAHSNLKGSLSDTYSGLGNSHRLMLLEEGMKFQKVVIDPKDSQFLESRQFSVTEIARWFNLPPHKIKDLTKSSFNNIESEDASFIRDRLIPDLVDLEQSYEIQLLTEADRNMSGRGRLYFKHNLKGLMRADTAARTAFYTAMLDRGVFCIDDVLELEDMPPLANGLGQKRFVQANMTSLENAGKPPEPPKPPVQPQLEPDPPPEKGNGKDKGAMQ
jgi:HK97 family phage portal protein